MIQRKDLQILLLELILVHAKHFSVRHLIELDQPIEDCKIQVVVSINTHKIYKDKEEVV